MATSCSPIVLIPGRPGLPGTNGTNGTNGQSAHTTVNGQFVMPAEGADVVVNVINSDWMVLGQNYGVETAGTMELMSIGSATQITLRNIENTALSLYLDNAPAGTVIPDGSDIGVGGIQGVAGVAAGGALIAANNLSDLVDAPTSRVNLGLSTAATRTIGIGNAQVARIDDAAGLTAGEVLLATIFGIESVPPVTARAAIGVVLGTAITQVAPATTALVNGQVVFATATGVETKTPTLARTALGISAGIINRVSFENQATVDAGAFTSGLWRTVPLNIKSVDTSGAAILAANQMTLQAGTYSFEAFCTGHQVDSFISRLFNVTTATPIKYGSMNHAGAGESEIEMSDVSGRFTIAGATIIELQAQCVTSRAANGFGLAPLFGAPYNTVAGVYFEQEA